MKREILCTHCFENTKLKFSGMPTEKEKEFKPYAEPYPGEFVYLYSGIALYDYNCDSCCRKLLRGERVGLLSIAIIDKYFPWEKDYARNLEKIQSDESEKRLSENLDPGMLGLDDVERET